jgi:hypothetical protein
MSAFATQNRGQLRRWAISVALALLLHVGIAVAVLTWRNSITPLNNAGPFMIDLAPSPAEPISPQSESLPAPASERLAIIETQRGHAS